MSLTAFIGRCPHCGHDNGENSLFDVARGTLTPAQQAKLNEQFANYAKQKPHLYGGCDEITTPREQVEKWKSLHESLTKLNEAQERRHEKQVEKLTKERDAATRAERETIEPVLAALGDIAGTSSSL